MAAASILLATGAQAAPRGEVDGPPAETRIAPWTGVLPACDDPGVLGEITNAFASREREYWASGLTIADYVEVRETAFRANGRSYIPRRYCEAQAQFNDGVRRRVVYNIAEQTGFISIGDGVTWCVVGLDDNHAFRPDCRAAGP